MAMRYPGGLIATSPVNAAYPSGVWTQSQTIPYASQNVWQNDQYWRNTTLLLHGDGTNGAQNNTFLDSSSNNFTITRNGNTTQGAFTPYQQNGYWSNYFGGSTNYYLTIPSGQTPLNLSTGDFTVECWVNVTDISQYALVLTVGSTAWQLGYEPSRKLYVYNGGNIMTSSTAITVGTWNHFAWTRSGTTMYLYLNGVQVATASNSSSVDLNGAYIATYAGGTSSYPFYGSMSNLRIVKGTAVYTSAFTPPTAPLTAISGTSLLTCQSNRFIDNSSNAFAITVTGTPSVQAFQPFPGPTTWSASVLSGSGYFDGSGDFLSLPTSAEASLNLTGTFTLEFWFYRNATGDMWFFSKGGGVDSWNATNGIAYQAFIESGLLYFQFYTGSIAAISVTAPPISQWNHFAVGRDGTTLRGWLNGSSIGTTTSTPTPPTTRNVMRIASNTVDGKVLNGYMAGLRVVNGTDVYGVSNTTITVPTAPPTAITNTQLLANFTNAGIYDNSMMNDLETVGNAQISTSVVKYGTGSMAFDGSGDYLIMPDAQTGQFLTGDFTVEYWCRFGSQGTNYAPQVGTLTSASPSGTWRFGTFTNNGGVYLAYHNGSTFVDVQFGSTAYNDNTWRHFALTRSGTTVRAFVDGTQVGTNQTVSQNFNSSNKVSVGAELLNPTYFNGYIDDLRITKGVARYISNFTPPIARMPNQ